MKNIFITCHLVHQFFLFFLVSIWLSGIQNHLGDTHTKFDTKLIRLAFLMGTVSSIVVSTKRDETCTNEWRRRAVQKPFGPFLPPGRTREGDQDRASVSVVLCFENGDEKSDGEGTKQRRRRPILVVTLLLSPSLRSAAASFLASLRACIATLRVAGSTASFAAPCTCACANLCRAPFSKSLPYWPASLGTRSERIRSVCTKLRPASGRGAL